MRRILPPLGIAIGAIQVTAGRALACATCFGAQDSAQTSGMNMAILGLLVIVGGVLAAFATFFVHLARRSRLTLQSPADASWPADRHHKTEKELVS